MISIFAGVTVAEKESAMPSLMIKGGVLESVVTFFLIVMVKK